MTKSLILQHLVKIKLKNMIELVKEYSSKCYFVDYETVLNYFQTNLNLHPLEGFWNLSCNNLVFDNDSIEDSDFNSNFSSWAIVQQNDKFYVCDYGKSYLKGINNFKASFRSGNMKNIFDYKCDFYRPEWSVNVPATLINDNIITYSYLVDKIYFNYEIEKDVMWNFIWTKTNHLQIN